MYNGCMMMVQVVADAGAGGSGRVMILYVLDLSQHGFQF